MKKRLDQIVVERGFAESREKAKRLILAGSVLYKTEVLSKPGMSYPEDIELSLNAPLKYVSRGGIKLEGFMKEITLNVKGLKCIDVGASTGGFTDFLLQNGARKVVCVDVGEGILHWKLRNDKRIEVHENVNARYLIDEVKISDFDLAVIDVSFISLKLIIQPVYSVLKMNANLICLVKPQFEAGREFIKKGGVVKSEEIQLKCVEDIKQFANANGFSDEKVSPCVIKGPAGNQEYFILFEKIK